MSIIETPVPISILDLKKFFVDKSTVYHINYTDSSLKGTQLLTYLSNLDIPCDIIFKNEQELMELMQAYISFTMLVNIPSLELGMIRLLLIYNDDSIENTDFIKNNESLFEQWLSKLNSLTLFNLYSVESDEFKQFVESHPLDETQSIEGINFVSLLKHPYFYTLYRNIKPETLKFYKSYFTEYMFKGKNMFSFWATENNPMFLLTYGITEQKFKADDYFDAKKQTFQELTNASPVQ